MLVVQRTRVWPHISGGGLPTKRSNKAVIQTKPGALEEKLTF